MGKYDKNNHINYMFCIKFFPLQTLTFFSQVFSQFFLFQEIYPRQIHLYYKGTYINFITTNLFYRLKTAYIPSYNVNYLLYFCNKFRIILAMDLIRSKTKTQMMKAKSTKFALKKFILKWKRRIFNTVIHKTNGKQ